MADGSPASARDLHFGRSVHAVRQALQEVSRAAEEAANAHAVECSKNTRPGVKPETQSVLGSIYGRYSVLEQLAETSPLELLESLSSPKAAQTLQASPKAAQALQPRAPSSPAPKNAARAAWHRSVAAARVCGKLVPRPKKAVSATSRAPEAPAGRRVAFYNPAAAADASREATGDVDSGSDEEDAPVPPRRRLAYHEDALSRANWGDLGVESVDVEVVDDPTASRGLHFRRSLQNAMQAVQGALSSMDLEGDSSPSEGARRDEDAFYAGDESSEEEVVSRKQTSQPASPSSTPLSRKSLSKRSTLGGRRSTLKRCLWLLRRCFAACGPRGAEQTLTAGQLALAWAAGAQRGLDSEERALVAADVQRFFRQVDLFGHGEISVDEWLHFALLEAHPPGPAAFQAITRTLQLLDRAAGLANLVRAWERLDPQGNGAVPRADVVAWLAKSTGRQPTCLGEDEESANISYAEFCAYQLGLEYTPVELCYYDLSKHVGKFLSPVLLWRLEEGIWHTGVVVFGQEYSYYGEICCDKPGSTPFGRPTKTRQLGATLWTRSELHLHVAMELNEKFNYDHYDVFRNNCNHCSDALVGFLLGRHVPDQVRFLPDRLMGTPVAKMLRPLLNKWLRGTKQEQGGGEADADAVLPAAPRRGNLVSDLSDAFFKESGGPEHFLLQLPGAEGEVVARVVAESGDGKLVDISWLDSCGRRRLQHGVQKQLLKPYEPEGFATEPGAGVYASALEALRDPEAGRRIAQLAARPDAHTALTLREFVSAHITACPNGSPLSQAKGHLLRRLRTCEECSRPIPRGDKYLSCRGCCHYTVCELCWEGCGGLRAVLQGGSDGRCPKGHRLERLFGSGLRAGATCKKCGVKELGALFPYFLCCPLCKFEVCPNCLAPGDSTSLL